MSESKSEKEKENQEDMIDERAFVAGATGYVGNAVAQHLLARGIETTTHVRPESRIFKSSVTHFESMGAKVDTTSWNLEKMTKTMGTLSPTLVFACLGTTKARRRSASEDKKAMETYRQVDYELTRMLIDACIASGCDAKIVYLSAMGASRRAKTEYMFVRGELEEYLRNCGLRYTIARPGLVTGDDRIESRPLEKLAGKMGDSFFSLLGKVGMKKLKSKYTSFTALELADAMVEIGLDEAYNGKCVEADELHGIAKI